MARGARGGGRLDAILLASCLGLAAVALALPQSLRVRVADQVRQTVFFPLAALERRGASVREAVLTRDSVLVARGSTVTEALEVRAVIDENDSLRRLLGLAARVRRGFIAADVIGTPSITEPFTVRLTVGADDGVVPFSPVVTADGLVGMIEATDATTSQAITWAHPDFRVSAMSADEDAFGIVQPHLASGPERWLLEMRGVPFRAKLDSGAVIVSSGLGATYPRGIPIGVVLGELVTAEKWARTYLIRPAVLRDPIGPVLVLLTDRVAGGLRNAWPSAAVVDSVALAAAAAGDSLARKAALDELAARRAILDSLRADSVRADTGRVDSTGTLRVPPDTGGSRRPDQPWTPERPSP